MSEKFELPQDQSHSSPDKPTDNQPIIKFRLHKNSERGTELGYATIPIKDVSSPNINLELRDALIKFYKYEEPDHDIKPVEYGGDVFA